MRAWTLALLALAVGVARCEYKALARANLRFATAMYRALSAPDRLANVFFSPLGVHSVATLAYLGARGETQREMSRGLGLSRDLPSVAASFRELVRVLRADPNTTLHLATTVYISAGLHVRNEFSDLARQHFGAKVTSLDFRSEQSAAVVNDWVAEATHGKITGLVTPQSLLRVTSMLVVNAVYFRGLWAEPFDRTRTSNATFTTSGLNQTEVPMMRTQGDFKYRRLASLGASILVLPYEGGLKSMVVVLPFDADGLASVEASLDVEQLYPLVDDLRESVVDVALPRFSLDSTTELERAFRTLGMTRMFAGRTDFTGITDGSVRVSSVKHRAYVEVDEEGSEAAAVSKVVDFLHARRDPAVFHADHPFVFFVRCARSRTVLFMGRFSQP